MDPYKSPAEQNVDSYQSDKTERKDLDGLGGWLILVGIGVVLSPIRLAILMLMTYPGIFLSDTWASLTTPGSEFYSPYWAPILIGEIVVNGLQFVACLYLMYLYFGKKKAFPAVYIGLTLFVLAFIVVDANVVKLVLPDEPIFDEDTIKELTRSAVSALIWIPYMLVSERVKATFTR
ncbi:DUF2569 domain-containing protein [Bremerella sp. T1]|uniref:DUF2569 domain-containing protein n=1 Tax=Bremerella sp. TYQ1 TaxID=3119568 RepID=UPI001CCF5D26|nr:DUF2569 domain-containing protein [Bremerella volcania]UBM34476.1 DUF2569 domain-containing protein [Bremerella volcania]